jgi:nucleoside-diphosphate-sugar epimerase
MTLTGRNVLVTGAAGFIGSHLTELLVADGAQVFPKNGWRRGSCSCR